jgi:hypothetical protein
MAMPVVMAMVMAMVIGFVLLGRHSGLMQMLLNCRLVELVRFPLDDFDRILRALTEAGTQSVAEVIRGQYRFAVDDLDCPFGAGWYAESAAVTFILVDLYDFSDHLVVSLLLQQVVMPEIIKPSAQDHPSAGKSHYLTDFLTILWRVAVDTAILASRLRIQRAERTFLDSVFKQFGAVRTEQ